MCVCKHASTPLSPTRADTHTHTHPLSLSLSDGKRVWAQIGKFFVVLVCVRGGGEGEKDTSREREGMRSYGVATISRLLKIINLFCRISSLL